MNQKLLRQIPKVDELMKYAALQQLCESVPAQTVTQAVRQVLEDLRKDILAGTVEEMPSVEALCNKIVDDANRQAEPSLKISLEDKESSYLRDFCISELEDISI
jgi:L-seryl-tRNA(Ser) seleniumtransferase